MLFSTIPSSLLTSTTKSAKCALNEICRYNMNHKKCFKDVAVLNVLPRKQQKKTIESGKDVGVGINVAPAGTFGKNNKLEPFLPIPNIELAQGKNSKKKKELPPPPLIQINEHTLLIPGKKSKEANKQLGLQKSM